MHKYNKVKLLYNYNAHPYIKLPGINIQLKKNEKFLYHAHSHIDLPEINAQIQESLV